MAFQPLSSRVAVLPDVLVGPLLRLVQANQVSVFLVLKAETKVTLEVFESETGGAGVNRRLAGTRSTVQLAAKMHAVCVTATPTGPPLTPGTQYVYDVKLGAADGDDSVEAPAGQGLFTPGVVRSLTSEARDLLTYPQGPQLPSFVLPPAAVDDLRILHASCRKPHGKGEDALAIGDEIVATAIADDFGRPHQLFLGGDQIYADDVAISLLAMILDAAGQTALGFPIETLPTGGGKPGSDFHPHARAEVVTAAGLTSDDADSHLMTFADFALMYAFAWSDALWPTLVPPKELPDFAAALPEEHGEWAAEANKTTGDLIAPPHSGASWKVAKELPHLEDFRRALPQVRRLLANVPTLMIFDDHEITDDWNLNLDWIKRTQDPAKLTHGTEPTALARAILRNGLVAYAIFQAWGNTPEQFGPGTEGAAGRTLLGAVEQWNGAATGTEVDQMTTCVGLPSGFDDHVATRAPGSLNWYFRKVWAGHEVIALDTRTRRGTVLPEDSGGPPALIYKTEDFNDMVRSGTPPPGPEQLVLVIAPAPVFGVPLHEAAARHLHAPWVRLSPGSDPEHWALTPYTREHFLGALMSHPNAGTDGIRRARAVVLSGDVHHGSAVHVRYSAQTPFKYTGPVEGVLAQLTSSALKNEDFLTHLIEALGFFTFTSQWRPIVGLNMPLIETSGWANPTGNALEVGSEFRNEMTTSSTVVTRTISVKLKGSPALHEFTYGVPFTDPPAVPAEPGYALSRPVEWSYAVRPWRGTLALRDMQGTLDPADPTQPADRTTRMVRAAQKHTHYTANLGPGQEVVGHNNIGDVTFDWGAGDDKTVIQKLWWRLDGTTDAHPYSRWEIPLANGST